MAASLNEIYRVLGELTGTVRAINEKVDALHGDMHDSEQKSDASRANVHRRLDEAVLRTTHLESDVVSVKGDVSSIKDAVASMQSVTDEVVKMREQARGAGTFGFWLLKLGGFILGAAGGVAATYTWLTGRPPP